MSIGRRPLLSAGALLGASLALSGRSVLARPSDQPVAALVSFETAPFPYDGVVPTTGAPFLDVEEGGRKGHTSPRGGIYWQHPTYSDSRVLLAFSRNFRADRSAVMVVYFHGNDATLNGDVLGRQRVLTQFEASAINGVLVAPQFAVNALDSSAGKFWQPGGFARFLSEAAWRLGKFVDASAGRVFGRMPVILIAYSGGYEPAAYVLTEGGVGNRIKGVVLLDAPFGGEVRFADFISRHRSAFFLSASTDATEEGNQSIKMELKRRGKPFLTQMPDRLVPGLVSFYDSPGEHADFVTSAWVPDPLAWILRAIRLDR